MFSERAAEHAEFTTAMTDRLAGRDRSIKELEGTIVLAEKRAMEARTRVKREARRANDAMELRRLAPGAARSARPRRPTRSRAGRGWDGVMDASTVVDLLAWEDKANAALGSRGRPQARLTR